MQQPDGSYAGSFGSLGPSSQVLLAVAAAGRNPAEWRNAAGDSLLDYLASPAAAPQDVGTAGRLAAGLSLAGINPLSVNPLLAEMFAQAYDPSTGLYDSYQSIWNQSLAIWGVLATGATLPQPAVDWLISQQNSDGGWGWAAGEASDTNSTAIVLQTLAATSRRGGDEVVDAAIAYLRGQQNADSGFPFDLAVSTSSDSNSTALVISSLTALGIDTEGSDEWIRGDVTPVTPLECLAGFQTSAGSFEWQAGTGGDLLSTAQVIPALSGAIFPIAVGVVPQYASSITLDAVQSATLYGSNAGAYRYYILVVPEGVSSVQVELEGLPGDKLVSRALGVNLYDQTGTLAEAGASDGSASAEVTVVPGETVLIQVYNYLPDLAASYTLSVH